MEQLYYNFCDTDREFTALIESAANADRDCLPLTSQQHHVINQDGNNVYLYGVLLTDIGDSWLRLWDEKLQPMLINYLKRCRETAPEGATGQYLVDCHRRWCDNTKELLKQAKEYFRDWGLNNHTFCANQFVAIDKLTEYCDSALLLYESGLLVKHKLNVPLAVGATQSAQITQPPIQAPTTITPRPTVKKTADHNVAYKYEVLKILQYNGFQSWYDKLFELGVFADNNGVWVFNSKDHKVWELALFIMLVDSVVNNGADIGTLLPNNDNEYNWKYFEGWIAYNGNPVIGERIRERGAYARNKKNDTQMSKSIIHSTLLDCSKDQ